MNKLSLNLILKNRRSVREFKPKAIQQASLKRLIWAAQGKTNNSGYRTAPSAHALHPLRLFVTASNIEETASGFYSVAPETDELILIHEKDIRNDLEKAAIGDQPWIAEAPLVLSICADFIAPCKDFADQPPYGQRGSRYVYIEAGAVAQNIQLQAAEEGIGSVLVAGLQDEVTATVLGLEEPFAPVLHLCVGWPA